MRKAIKAIVLKYFEELKNDGDMSRENLESYADNFVNELFRYIEARRDFKED